MLAYLWIISKLFKERFLDIKFKDDYVIQRKMFED